MKEKDGGEGGAFFPRQGGQTVLALSAGVSLELWLLLFAVGRRLPKGLLFGVPGPLGCRAPSCAWDGAGGMSGGGSGMSLSWRCTKPPRALVRGAWRPPAKVQRARPVLSAAAVGGPPRALPVSVFFFPLGRRKRQASLVFVALTVLV